MLAGTNSKKKEYNATLSLAYVFLFALQIAAVQK